MRKRLLVIALVAVLVMGGISAGTALVITQPVNATVTIAGLGTSPSFDVIDNAFDAGSNAKSGAAAGYIDGNDNYVIGFGATNPGGNWALSFGRNQTAVVGEGNNAVGGDFVFKLQNNYANAMTVDLDKVGGTLGANVVIKVIKDDGTVQWTLTGNATSTNWTIDENDLTLTPGSPQEFYLKVENTSATAGTYSPTLKFSVTAS